MRKNFSGKHGIAVELARRSAGAPIFIELSHGGGVAHARNVAWPPPPATPTRSRAGEAAMNIAVPNEGTDLSPYLPDEHGLFFIYHFTPRGCAPRTGGGALDVAQLPE